VTAPAPLPEIDRGEAVNLARHIWDAGQDTPVTPKGRLLLAHSIIEMDKHIIALRARLQEEIAKREEVEKFIESAFAAHPNLDLDIAALSKESK
jgi:hypothetical protein